MKEIYLIVSFIEVVLVIFMQWQVYLRKIIITFAVSSIIIALFLFANGMYINNVNIIILAFLTLFVRGVFIPFYMMNKLNYYHYKEREPRHIISTATSIVVSVILIVLSYVVYNYTMLNLGFVKSGSIALALILQGMFLIISRNNAFIQLIGYMVMENSLFLLAGYVFSGLPLILEGGILLDLVGIVMISGIVMRLREDAVSNIPEEFEEFKG